MLEVWWIILCLKVLHAILKNWIDFKFSGSAHIFVIDIAPKQLSYNG